MSDSPSPFAGTTPIASLAHADGAVTLVQGQTFALSGRTGDMSSDLPHGLFVLDTRILSRWELRANGHRIEPLAVEVVEPFAAAFVARGAPPPGHADADLVVFRRRHVGRGMRERIIITNHGMAPTPLSVEVVCDVDFADLFEVKESRVRRRGHHLREFDSRALRFGHRGEVIDKDVTVTLSQEATVEPGVAMWTTTLAPGATWECCLEVTVGLDGRAIEPRFRCRGDDADAVPARRLDEWRARLPVIDTDHSGLTQTLRRSGSDLGALRIFDPEHPDLPILAAGAPWFMTVFGRDSLLTAWMTLIADPSLARGVLETLARFQGTEVNASTEEEPGKILHEMRFGETRSLSLGGGDVYYGSIDATPLFVMLLGELRRWDPSDAVVDRLLPHADRALEWIEAFGDRDGDGYVEYQRATDHGLANQGWKDSWDAIRFADGTLAQTPIALCEVQGYVYAAYVARAHFAREAGDTGGYERWATKARELRRRFNEDFWLDEHGSYALGLDADKKPIDAVVSNVGHCLWTGIVDPERAGLVADRLLAPDMFSGFGVRTLATSMAAYNPVSYHNGSVWPHDNAICAAGLARYGFTGHAQRIIEAQIDVASTSEGALPELFAGFDRADLSVPAAYPTSCSPQAWAAASPLLWLRTMLRLDPWTPHGEVWIHPELPPSIRRIQVDGITVAGKPLTVTVDGDQVEVAAPDDLRVVHRARPPLTAALGPDNPST
ncbi:MAG TPA: glycogen debranching N-terminal domain-containing protein [Acidimicrobiales bacterium]